MKSNRTVFVRYEYYNGNSMSEPANLTELLEEFATYKKEVYELWMDDDSLFPPREIFAITYLSFDNNGNIATIEFSERAYKNG